MSGQSEKISEAIQAVGEQGSALALTFPRSEPEAEPLLLKKNSNWKRITLLGYSLSEARFQRLAG
jgi:hypothetical protein